MLHPQRLLVKNVCRRLIWRASQSITGTSRLPVRHILTRGIFNDSTTASHNSNGTRRRRITFLTDVEGDAAYLDRYVRQSRVLTFRPVAPRLSKHSNPDFADNFSSCAYFPYDHCIDFCQDNADDMLVFGGDIWDKGGRDLYCIRQLLDFKRRYPDRVHWTLGNRDINKMRIPQEMGLEDDQGAVLPAHDGVYWLNHTGRIGDPSDPDLRPPTTAAERLKWMLGQTMGSPDAFEGRRTELQLERKQQQQSDDIIQQQQATDDEVVKSYRRSCHPTKGEMGNYLANSHLAFRVGEVLFVHGALPLSKPVLQKMVAANQDHDTRHFWDDLAFAMPWALGTENNDKNVSIEEWLDHLQIFVETSFQAWKEHYATETCRVLAHSSENIWALRGGYNSKLRSLLPYTNLLQYGMGWLPDRRPNVTCVYSGWTRDGMPKWFFPDNGKRHAQLFARLTNEFFRRSGLRLILSGHQPQGDFPTPIRLQVSTESKKGGSKHSDIGQENCWILCCDTSYSGDTEWISSGCQNLGRGIGLGFRGDVTVWETLVEQCLETGGILDIRCHGVLSDGSSPSEAEFWSASSKDNNSQTNTTDRANVGCVLPTDCAPPVDANLHAARWWTKAVFNDGTRLLTTAKGYDVVNHRG